MSRYWTALALAVVTMASGCRSTADRAEVRGLRAGLAHSGPSDDLTLQFQWTARKPPWLLKGIEPATITYWSPLGFKVHSERVFVGFPADFRAMRVPTLLVPLQTSRPFFADRVTVALGASGLSAALDCSW